MHMRRQVPTTIGGKVVLVGEPELGSGPDSGYITFWDATDPARPTYLSRWAIPGNYTALGGINPHYFDLRDGRIALAHYHAGWWVVDVHDAANLAHPRTVAY